MSIIKKQKNIIQFTPYFFPHIWGVEKVVEWIFLKWIYWKSSIFSGDNKQSIIVYNNSSLQDIDSRKKIFFPCKDIVDNFPLPLIWTKKYISSHKKLRNILSKEEDIIITHTRFFLTSFLWGIYAKIFKKKWIHIEHGSDFVKLSSPFKNKCAYIYDKTIGSWVIKKADRVLAISKKSKEFVENELWWKNIKIWYRWMDMSDISQKEKAEIKIVYIGRLVHLKWVDNLMDAYIKSNLQYPLTIIWDWPEREKLQKKSQGKNIIFLWEKSHDEIITFLSQNNCILINPSYQEGMPTTVIEWLATKNVVIATNVGGTSEISSFGDLVLVSPWDIKGLSMVMKEVVKKYFELQGKSYTHMRETFSWEKSLEKLYELI